MFTVVYYSLTGNTRKVADAIAGELGVVAKDVRNVSDLSAGDYVFLGSGCYGAVLPGEITEFINRSRLQNHKVVLFNTSGFGMKKELGLFENQLRNKGVNVVDRYECFGRFAAVRMGHPDAGELQKAREFARRIATKIRETGSREFTASGSGR